MKNSIYILIVPFFFLNCKKENNSIIPLVAVNITINTNSPAYNPIAVPGGWMYINGGSRGMIIYRNSNESFSAFDRHCTFEPDNDCARVSVDATNITGIDTCCGSKFLLPNGSVTQGPANLPLKNYRTSFDGSILRITN